MNFDRFTMGLLVLRPDAPKLSEAEENALQDAHIAHLAKLHDQGVLLAAGPLLGLPDRDLRGLEIYKALPRKSRRWRKTIRRYSHRFLPWMVPAGAMSFAHARFPRAMAEA